MTYNISVIIPCKNEAQSIGSLITDIINLNLVDEIIVVDDGSTDDSYQIISELDVKCVRHIYSKGNGASIKAGARIAKGDIIVFMDADGQHQAKSIAQLLEKINEGFDMVVGARSSIAQASKTRLLGNKIYNRLASLITGHKVLDLTSGFRAVKRSKFLEFLALLPNGFSYPTTITMAFFRSGYSINYTNIDVIERKGDSHISIIKDGIKFLLIIFKVGTLYSPLKIYAPLSGSIFLMGLSYYLYIYFTYGRFTNMSLLLFVTAIFVFIFGLISEQITTLIYLNIKDHHSDEISNNEK